MTHEEYLKQVREALASLNRSDKEAVHAFNEWRNKLYEEYLKGSGGSHVT